MKERDGKSEKGRKRQGKRGDRKSVVEGKSVDIGGRGISKKKKKKKKKKKGRTTKPILTAVPDYIMEQHTLLRTVYAIL